MPKFECRTDRNLSRCRDDPLVEGNSRLLILKFLNLERTHPSSRSEKLQLPILFILRFLFPFIFQLLNQPGASIESRKGLLVCSDLLPNRNLVPAWVRNR